MKLFFSYDINSGFQLHKTLAEAKSAAEKAFGFCIDMARNEGWPEEVDEICYGELRGRVVETRREPWNEGEHGSAPEENCERVEYALLPLKCKRKDMIEVLATSMTREMVPWLIEWIRDPNRKEAIHAFTEGPVRQVAYAVEYALRLERETTPKIPPLTMRPTEQYPRCGFIQHVTETSLRVEAMKSELARMRNRIEQLRGGLKSAAGWFYDADDLDHFNKCTEMAGDMEPPLSLILNAGIDGYELDGVRYVPAEHTSLHRKQKKGIENGIR